METVHVDLIGLWKVLANIKDGQIKENEIQALTCIGTATGFCEIIAVMIKHLFTSA